MKLITILIVCCSTLQLYAQSVGINTPTPDASAVLDVKATDKGILIPRVILSSTIVAAPVVAPLTSLLVYTWLLLLGRCKMGRYWRRLLALARQCRYKFGH
jgi:hypothetical protein